MLTENAIYTLANSYSVDKFVLRYYRILNIAYIEAILII